MRVALLNVLQHRVKSYFHGIKLRLSFTSSKVILNLTTLKFIRYDRINGNSSSNVLENKTKQKTIRPHISSLVPKSSLIEKITVAILKSYDNFNQWTTEKDIRNMNIKQDFTLMELYCVK